MKYDLSIIIPTKNRYNTLISLCNYLSECEGSFEVLIADNSDNNSSNIDYFNSLPDNFNYNYSNENLSMRENSLIALEMAQGKYLTMIGDDDGVVISEVFEVIKILDREKLDFALSQDCKYLWPNLKTRIFGSYSYGMLRKYSTSNDYKVIVPKDELDAVYQLGGTTINNLPRLYQGLVRKELVSTLIEKYKTPFLASMPDMSSSVAIATMAGNGIRHNKVFIVNGVSSKSGGGLGAAGKHQGGLTSGYGLTEQDIKEWPAEVPSFWSGGTVWAASFIITLKKLDKFESDKFNQDALKSYCRVFQPKLSSTFLDYKLNIKYVKSVTYIFRKRLIAFIYNLLFYVMPKRKFSNIYKLLNWIEKRHADVRI